MVPEIQEGVKKQPSVFPVRVKFAKTGLLQYISHLDLNRTLTRALVRARVPVWFTEGFNPHPKLVFATPLSVGAESVCEFCDLKTVTPPDCGKIRAGLSAALPEGLEILEVYVPEKTPEAKFAAIAFSEYKIRICTAGAGEALAAACAEALASPLTVTKRTKSGEREMDLQTLIARAAVGFDAAAGELCIDILLPADSANFTNPELVIRALSARLGILQGPVTEEYYAILRTQLYLADKKTPFR